MSLQAAVFRFIFRYALAYFSSTNPSVEDWRDMYEKSVRYIKLPSDVLIQPVNAGCIPAEWITPPGINNNQVILYLHGGAFFLGSINTHREFISRLGRAAGMRSLAISYRLAPEHPYPAALEDATNAYRWLLAEGYDPANIIIAGDSAGGGLVISTLVSLRDSSQPLPAGAVSLSGWLDLALTGDSIHTKSGVDPINKLSYLQFSGPLYAGHYDLKNPLISPIYADLTELPPMLLQVGSEETLLDDSKRLAERARAAGVDVTLEVWEGMIHVFQIYAKFIPEARQAIERIGLFMRQQVDREGFRNDPLNSI